MKLTDRWKLDTGVDFFDDDGKKVGKDDRYDEIEEVEKANFYDHIEEVQKFNPYHDERGRFASANGYTSYTYSPGKSVAHDKAVARKLASDLVGNALGREKALTSTLQGCASQTGGEMVGLEYAVKTQSSLSRKIYTEMKEMGISGEEAAANMKDVNRYTMKFGEDDLTAGYESTIKALQSQGHELVKVKNTLANPNAEYRGINTNLRSPDGAIWELQFHTAKSLEVKEVNHKLYEKQRLDKTSPAEKAALGKQMAENAASIPTPKGAESIKNVNLL